MTEQVQEAQDPEQPQAAEPGALSDEVLGGAAGGYEFVDQVE